MSSNDDDELKDSDEDSLSSNSTRDEAQPGAGKTSQNLRTESQGQSNLAVTLVRDSSNWLSALQSLQPTDVILLLTPVVVPISIDPDDTSDPFECFGRALASRHPKVRHQPYTNRNGITSTHVGLIKRSSVLIFVMNDASISGEKPHVEAAQVTQVLSDGKPLIIILTCSSQDLLKLSEDFPTVIQSRDYSRPTLEMTASLLFGENDTVGSPMRAISESSNTKPQAWSVEQWNEAEDIIDVSELWGRLMDPRFAIHANSLTSLLQRPGYARHYIVKHPSKRYTLGFCATYLTYVDQAGEKLIASVAVLLVRPEYQGQGIGLSLHNHAIDQLRRTRGVARLQLGSTFPRILYGPLHSPSFNHGWYLRRGWQTDKQVPGQGLTVCDLVLDFDDWKFLNRLASTNGTQFRSCTQQDMARVLELVEQETARENHVGWFDQYSRLINDINVKHVIVAVESGSIVAVALTYTPSNGSPIAADLPWARQLGNDVGGVTCICASVTRRDSVMVPLLDACAKSLREQGMSKMFLDGVISNVDDFKKLGFQEWAKYRDVWRNI